LSFYFKHFLLTFSFSQVEEKKNHREKKNVELTFKLSFCPLTFDSCFWLLVFALLFQALSPWHFLFLKWKTKKKTTKKKTIKKKKCREGRELTFLLSLLHLG